MKKIKRTPQEWQALLTPEQYAICRLKKTDAPFSHTLELPQTPQGYYACTACQLPLFSAMAKFESGSGWPSFYDTITVDAVETIEDLSHGMRRLEVVCARCDSHLGHVFNDGPLPTGLRYCINATSLAIIHRSDDE